MAMDDLLKAILGGAMAPQQGMQPQAGADPMTDMLEAILGGGASPQQRRPAAQSGSLDDLLEDFMGGSAQETPAPAPAGGMGDLLEAILGGGAAPQRRSAAPSGGLGDILGAILGGSGGQNAFLGPIADALAEKTGLPPAIANTVLAFLINKLFSGKDRGIAAAPAPAPRRSTRRAAPADEGMDLDHLLEQMGGDMNLQPSYFSKSGLAQELAAQSGLDEGVAERSLEEAFGLLGGQLQEERRPRPSNQTRSGGLEHLLDTWD